MRERIIIANWKMNGTLESARAWIEAYRTLPAAANCRAVLCAPFVYLPEIVERLRGTPLEVGAQDVNENPSGAYTGEISAGMLADIGVSWCIVGHSERRRYYGDTDNRVAMKALAAAKAGIQEGDVITKLGDDEITSADGLIIALRSHEVGEKVEITLMRGKEEKKVTVELGSDEELRSQQQDDSATDTGNGGITDEQLRQYLEELLGQQGQGQGNGQGF